MDLTEKHDAPMNPAATTTASATTIGAVHGWAMHGGMFQTLAGALPEANWRFIDLPGHGKNRNRPWPTDTGALIEQMIDDLPEGSWLLGWSLGGQLAMQAALQYPQRFAGLVLVSATPCFVSHEHWPDGLEAGMLKAMALELAADPEVVVNRFLALEIRGSADARYELERLKSLALAHGLPDNNALLAGVKHLAGTDLSARLPEIECPVLLLGGQRDKLVPWNALEHSHRLLPNSRLVNIPGAAHAPFLTDADAVAAAIKDFMLADADSA